VPAPPLVRAEDEPAILFAILVLVLMVNVRVAEEPKSKFPVWKFRIPVLVPSPKTVVVDVPLNATAL